MNDIVTDNDLNNIKGKFDRLSNSEQDIFIRYLADNISKSQLSDSTCFKTQLFNAVNKRLFIIQNMDEKHADKILEQTSHEINQEGEQYLKGVSVGKNLSKAFSLFQKAADLNNPSAMNNLGLYYIDVGCAERNPERAFQLFEKAAKLNDYNAMFNLATCFLRGISVGQDFKNVVVYVQ